MAIAELTARPAGLRRALLPAAFLGIAGLLLYGAVPWPCPMATLLRIPCPCCGLTRATRLALHGDLAAATRMHPLWFLVLPAVALAAAVEIQGYWRHGTLGAAERSRYAPLITKPLVALLLALWLLRFTGALGGPVVISINDRGARSLIIEDHAPR